MDDYRGPVIEEYQKRLDPTLIDQSLRMTPHERLDRLVAMAKLKDELERAEKRFRAEQGSGDKRGDS
jgi:hypothetical protein